MRSRSVRWAVAVCTGAVSSAAVAADMGTAFTYQGRLIKSGVPVTSAPPHCDFTFGLWDAAGGGNQKGNSPQAVNDIAVVGGLFTVQIDFGPAGIDGTARWLEIAVQCPGDPVLPPLAPRQELKPAPHALALPGLYTQQHAISPNLIGGHPNNSVGAGIWGATIGGGGDALSFNQVNDTFGTVGGGHSNTAMGIATVGGGSGNTALNAWATVGGGRDNFASDPYSSVGGGRNNAASAAYATIAGGGPSDVSSPAAILATRNFVTDDYGTIGGGGNNQAGDASAFTTDRPYATVGGGFDNTASGERATVGGGTGNTASGNFATVGGGQSNTASGPNSTVGGGVINSASGNASTVPGGDFNLAGGTSSFAAGFGAKVRDGDPGSGYYSGDGNGDEGTFVWADSTLATFTSTGPNQFLVRASGGVGINNNAPLFPTLQVGTFGDFTNGNGAYLDPAGLWQNTCDRNAKENFEHLDRQALLDRLTDLPITRWNFKGQEESITHIGPVAQDFHAAFGTGRDDKHLAALDTAGVALAAIQGLNQIVQEKDCRIGELEQRNDEFEQQNQELKRRLDRIEAILAASLSGKEE